VTLAEYVANQRRSLLEDLETGNPPRKGEFDSRQLREASLKGRPSMGACRFEPDSILLEYVFSNERGVTAVFEVRLVPPERIVFLPVPEWVIENIWQGGIEGSYHFESHARELAADLLASLEPEANRSLFDSAGPMRRE
jgi:hypothetical protein